jgi:predicted GIY-YIG superfamily endonuclease
VSAQELNIFVGSVKTYDLRCKEKSLELKMKNENSTESGGCDIIGNMLPMNVEKDLNDITLKNVSGIYKIINQINKKYYIGGARNIRRRWNEHRTDLNREIHHNQQFIGTRNDFYTKYNLQPSSVKNLIKLKRKSHKGWKLVV